LAPQETPGLDSYSHFSLNSEINFFHFLFQQTRLLLGVKGVKMKMQLEAPEKERKEEKVEIAVENKRQARSVISSGSTRQRTKVDTFPL